MARNFTAASSQELRNTAIAAATAAPLTLACWFRPANVAGGTSKTLIAIDDGAAEFFLLRSTSITGRCQAVVTGGFTSENATAPTDGVWAHFAAVFVSTSSRFAYFNGIAGTENADASTPVVTQTHIGATLGFQFAAGDIAEAAVWQVALSTAEIGRLALGYAPALVRRASLAAYWPLRMNASPEPDQSPLARVPLTLVNAPPFASHPPGIIYGTDGVRGGRRARRVA